MPQYCTFLIDQQLFGIDVRKVQEVLPYQEMTTVPLAPKSVLGLINLRGQIVTAIDLRTRLGMPGRPSDRLPMNVVLGDQDCLLSLLVDEIREVIEVDEESFEKSPESLSSAARELIRGAYKLEDRLLLVLDGDKAIEINALKS